VDRSCRISFLIASQAPYWPEAVPVPPEIVSKADFDAGILADNILTVDGKRCINTCYTRNIPHPATTPQKYLLAPQTHATLGDRLSDKNVSWKWYSGGWDDAVSGNPQPDFQFHHQAYAFFANFAENTTGRAEHLRDEKNFYSDLAEGNLPSVSWVKFSGEDNEHPGYAQLYRGQKHAADLINLVRASNYWNKTAIFITYDEFGGHFDHVVPPPRDQWGPGSRIPMFIISPHARRNYVDRTSYTHDSIHKFLNVRFGLTPLTDAAAKANNFDASFDLADPSPANDNMKTIMLIAVGSILALGVILFVYCLCRRRPSHNALLEEDTPAESA